MIVSDAAKMAAPRPPDNFFHDPQVESMRIIDLHTIAIITASNLKDIRVRQGLFWTFLVVFWSLLNNLTMSQTITVIHCSSQIFRVLELVSFKSGLFS